MDEAKVIRELSGISPLFASAVSKKDELRRFLFAAIDYRNTVEGRNKESIAFHEDELKQSAIKLAIAMEEWGK